MESIRLFCFCVAANTWCVGEGHSDEMVELHDIQGHDDNWCVCFYFLREILMSKVFGNDWSCYPPKQVGFIFQEVFSTGFPEGFHVIGLSMTIFKNFEVPSKCFAKLCHWVTWHDGQINVYTIIRMKRQVGVPWTCEPFTWFYHWTLTEWSIIVVLFEFLECQVLSNNL